MSDYKYICPTDKGYKPFTIKWSTFVKIVPTREGRRFTKVKGYVKDKHIILHYLPTVTGCVLCTLLFPVALLSEGLSNYKEIWKDMVMDNWYAEEKGNFSSDKVYKRDNNDTTFQDLLDAAEYD